MAAKPFWLILGSKCPFYHKYPCFFSFLRFVYASKHQKNPYKCFEINIDFSKFLKTLSKSFKIEIFDKKRSFLLKLLINPKLLLQNSSNMAKNPKEVLLMIHNVNRQNCLKNFVNGAKNLDYLTKKSLQKVRPPNLRTPTKNL